MRKTLPKSYSKGSWSEQALRVLTERYLLKDSQGNILETPEEMCYRVASSIAQKKKFIKEYYAMMVNQLFLPNSPTLMNAGKSNKLQYSACYVLPVGDSLIEIFDAIKNAALIHQSGGGTGFSFSRLRPRSSFVASSGGQASGPVGFMRIFDAATQEVKQGGMRRGANMGVLRVDHPDILEFIDCKTTGGISNFNISVGATEKFMEALENNGEYELIDPRSKNVTAKLKAAEVFEKIALAAWKTGDPGMIWLDRMNKSSANPVPEMGPIEGTNPCIIGSTLVATEKGLVKIEELVKKRMEIKILTDNRVLGGKGVALRPHNHLWDNGKKEVWRLATHSGLELLATPDHKIMTPRGWVPICQLKPKEDKVLIQAEEGAFNLEKNLPFVPQNVFKGKNGRISKLNLPCQWSSELGQVLGWLVGDGWLRMGDKNCRVGFTFSAPDKGIMDHLCSILNRWYSQEIKPIKRKNGVWHLSYHGKYFGEFFEKLGVKPVKAQNKEVPASLFTAPKEVVIGFLQGLFSADGTINIYEPNDTKYIRLTSKSEKLLHGVQLLLLNLRIPAKIYNRSRKPRKTFSYKRKTYLSDGVCFEIEIRKESVIYFLKEIGFLGKKHQEKIKKLYQKNYQKENYYDTVANIVFAGKATVFDITEPITYSMIANGIVVADCGEQPLYPNEACNLGSINLAKFAVDGKVDWPKLKKIVHLAVRFLDDVIEVNPYPLAEIDKACKANRRIGLGVMGWADLLFQLKIPYDSQEALELAEKVMKFINEEGHQASAQLAKEQGAFPSFKKSLYKDDKPLRNATITTIAPTGSLSIIANCSSGIEPLFALSFSHIVGQRHLNFVNPYFLQAAQKAGLKEEVLAKIYEEGRIDNLPVPAEMKKVFKIAHEIGSDWHVKTQAAFQKYTDNAVSKTINLPNNATPEDVRRAYLLAYQSGCLGITVFRDGSKEEQVLHLGKGKKPVEAKEEIVKKPRPAVVSGATYQTETPIGTAFITINQSENSEPLETFINIGKAGSDVAAVAEALGRLISLVLRVASPLPVRERAQEIVDQLQGIGGARSLGFGEKKVRSLPDAIAKAMANHFGLKSTNGNNHNGSVTLVSPTNDPSQNPVSGKRDLCPKCGEATVVYEEGCRKCYSCGFSEC